MSEEKKLREKEIKIKKSDLIKEGIAVKTGEKVTIVVIDDKNSVSE